MKDHVMKIRVNGTDHALFPFPVDGGEKRTHRSAAEEWQPHRTQGSGTGWADRQWGEACCCPTKTKRNWSALDERQEREPGR
jgi:hypothetical protein